MTPGVQGRRRLHERCVVKKLMCVWTVAAMALIGATAAAARAGECDKLTYLTFSAPVALPGVTLPAGTYRFSHRECLTTSGILEVSSADGMQVYATLHTIPTDRTATSDRAEVILAEMPAGSPDAVKAWFYPGDATGDELVYPKNEARTVERGAEQTVFAANGAD